MKQIKDEKGHDDGDEQQSDDSSAAEERAQVAAIPGGERGHTWRDTCAFKTQQEQLESDATRAQRGGDGAAQQSVQRLEHDDEQQPQQRRAQR